MHICVFAYIEFMHLTKWENDFESLKQKAGEDFWEKELLVYACFSHLVDAYICV